MPTNDDRPSFRPAVLVVIVGLVAVVGFLSLSVLGGQTSSILSTVGSAVDTPGQDSPDTTRGSDGDTTAESDIVPVAAVVDVTRPDLLVIRTGSIELQVDDVDRAVDDAGRDIGSLGGYVSASEQVGEGSGLSSSVTYRIPVAAWDDALAGLRALATRVVAAQTQTEDVTAQVVDLNARILNLQVTERALQEIMASATKTSDVLDVQAELTKVRGEIEEAVAQRQHLQDQAAFSTLTATFGLKPVPAVVATRNEFDPQDEVDKATARLVHVIQRAVTAGIWFAIVWLPILLVLGVVVGISGLVAVLMLRARRVAPPPDPASSGPA